MSSNLLRQEDYLHVLLLALPLVVGGVLHMLAVKWNVLSYLRIPIHQRWFGQNKTWRGFIIMPLATWPGVVLSQYLEGLFDLNTPLLTLQPAWYLALASGLGYCLAELPNSYLKRRLGIREGQTSEKYKIFFIILDQADSIFGCLIVYKLILPLPWNIFWFTIAFGTLLHLFINVSLYKLKVRKNPF